MNTAAQTNADDMAMALTSLIEDATQRAGALNEAATRDAIHEHRLREPSTVLERRICGAAHALETAEARALQAQGLLAKATRHLTEAQAVERRIEELSGARLGWLEARLAEMARHHDEMLRKAEDAFRRRAEAMMADLGSRLDLVQARGDVLAGGLDELAARAGGTTAGAATQAPAEPAGAALDTARAIERALETREALRAEVGILTMRVRSLQAELTGAVLDAREAMAEARAINPSVIGTTADQPAAAKARRRRAA